MSACSWPAVGTKRMFATLTSSAPAARHIAQNTSTSNHQYSLHLVEKGCKTKNKACLVLHLAVENVQLLKHWNLAD